MGARLVSDPVGAASHTYRITSRSGTLAKHADFAGFSAFFIGSALVNTEVGYKTKHEQNKRQAPLALFD